MSGFRLRAIPSFAQGFAKNETEAVFPSLWKGLQLFVSPSVGIQPNTLRDFSANRNNAALSSYASGDFVPGFKGIAWHGDGTSKNITATHIAQYDISMDITTAAWYSRDAVSVYKVIIAKTNYSLWDYEMYFDATNHLKFYSDAFGGLTGPVISDTNVWHHVAVTRIDSVITFYVDGEIASTSSIGSGVSMATNTFDIHIGTDDNVAFFVGKLDDIGVWSRALDPIEVKLLATGNSPLLKRKLGLGRPPVGAVTFQNHMMSLGVG